MEFSPEILEKIGQVRNCLKMTEKGTVANSLQNCQFALSNDPNLSGAVRLNLLSGREEITGPVFWDRSAAPLSDTDQKYICLYLEKYYGLTNQKKIADTFGIIANENRFHPIRDYLTSLLPRWDGTPRIRHALHHFLGAEEDSLSEECLRVFMLGAVERVFNPGCKFEQMLCLVGGQGAGKSSFFRLLAVRDEWFSDDLKKLDDDYIYRKLQGHWIIEMPEMIATSGAKSIEEIKAFLSRQKDTYKTPYLVHPEDRPRQCVFAGTTNRLDFLPRDRSGNRRFLPVFVCPEKAEQHPLQDEAASRAYIDQMWAEIMRIRSTGMYSLCLGRESEQQLADRQEAFSQEDYRAGIILGFLREYRGDRVCSRQLFREALDNRYEEPGDQDIRNIREIVDTGIASGKIRGWQRTAYPVRFPGYGTQRGWERRKEDRKAPEQLSFIEARHVPGNPWEEQE